MPLDDPFDTQASKLAALQDGQLLPGPLGQDHAEQIELSLYRAAVAARPDVKAALAVLTTLRPERWRDDRPATAIQFVIHAPSVASSTSEWLAQYGPGGTLRGEPGPSLIGPADPGGLVPTASGPVPDPLAVPQRLTARLKSSKALPVRKNIKK
jgi:hypothetical protein